MLLQLAKILQKKYPHLQIRHVQLVLDGINIYVHLKHKGHGRWIMTIDHDSINVRVPRKGLTVILMTPNDPEYFQKIDEYLCPGSILFLS